MVRIPAVWRSYSAKPGVAARLLGVDAVAFSAGHFADCHVVCLGSAFDSAITGGGQVVVPVGVGGNSILRCEDIADVRVGFVREVLRRVDVLPPAFAAVVMQQDHRGRPRSTRRPCPRWLETPRWSWRSSRSCRIPF